MDEDNLIWLILGMLVVILISMCVIGFIVSENSHEKCRTYCLNNDALTCSWEAGGGYTDDKDICTCYFEDSTKTFRMGELP